MNPSPVFQVDYIEQDSRNGSRYVLVRISGEWRHYINSFPDFIEFVYFPLLSGLHKIAHHAGIKNLRSIDVLRDVQSDLGYFALFWSGVYPRSSGHINRAVHRICHGSQIQWNLSARISGQDYDSIAGS
jgi:hypothetical protein